MKSNAQLYRKFWALLADHKKQLSQRLQKKHIYISNFKKKGA